MASIPIQNINNDISINEDVLVKVEHSFGDVIDRINISEDVSVWTDTLYISVNDSINVDEISRRLFNLGPIVDPNPDLDTYFDCGDVDSAGNPDRGVIALYINIAGEIIDISVASDPIGISLTLHGTGIEAVFISADTAININLNINYSDTYINPGEENFIKWSGLGNLDFTLSNANLAGKRPMPWSGMIYKIIKIDSGAIVYGANGITIITPTQNKQSRYDQDVPEVNTYMPKTIYKTGIKGKNSVIETLTGQYFIDVNNKLCIITGEGVKVLDFSEYLKTLNSNLIMSFDEINNLIYICDGAVGFIYNTKDNSLGSGPTTITSIGHQDGVDYFMSSDSSIIIPALETTFDILDFETRRSKTIHKVELETDVSGTLYVSFDYRNSELDSFSSTPWVMVNPGGQAYLPCYGKEFKLKIKLNNYEAFNIYKIKIHGDINDN